jgi:glycosyltransferase involved in cell wall biosynthesis
MFRMGLYAHPHVRNSGSLFGYAYTYQEIEKHMRNYSFGDDKMNLTINSPMAQVQLYYGSPPGFFFDHQYKIQMTQWESTLVPPNWVDHAKDYDEWWTANYFGADAFINAGVPPEKIKVFEHGVDAKTWFPKKRKHDGPIRFLHVDSGSPRKRGDFATDAFKAAFGNSMDYELTRKYSHGAMSDLDWFDEDVLASAGEWQDSNVRHIKENLTLEQLVNLFHFHDVLIYPSEGEGFGLIPLQALATGMPVISTGRWCSYERFLNGNVIESHMGVSPIHETYTRFGDVVIPDFDSTVSLMKKVAENIEGEFETFYAQTEQVAKEYDWQTLTNKAINSLVERIGIEKFNTGAR